MRYRLSAFRQHNQIQANFGILQSLRSKISKGLDALGDGTIKTAASIGENATGIRQKIGMGMAVPGYALKSAGHYAGLTPGKTGAIALGTGVLGLGGAGYLGYKAYQNSKANQYYSP